MSDEEKARLRARYRRAMETIPQEELDALSRRIHALVRTIPEIATATAILTYVALPHEIQTLPLIEQWRVEGKRVFVPSFADRNSSMAWCVLTDTEELAPGSFGVMQPRDATPETPPPHAPVIVPGLAFTRTGHRLGRGGGHYDRFVATHRGLSVGLTSDAMLAGELPVEPHDVPVDVVVTDRGIFVHSRDKIAGKN